jgi:hypothetical protein
MLGWVNKYLAQIKNLPQSLKHPNTMKYSIFDEICKFLRVEDDRSKSKNYFFAVLNAFLNV